MSLTSIGLPLYATTYYRKRIDEEVSVEKSEYPLLQKTLSIISENSDSFFQKDTSGCGHWLFTTLRKVYYQKVDIVPEVKNVLNVLRECGILKDSQCKDVSIQLEKTVLKVDGFVLRYFSEYFNSLLKSEMVEGKAKTIRFKGPLDESMDDAVYSFVAYLNEGKIESLSFNTLLRFSYLSGQFLNETLIEKIAGLIQIDLRQNKYQINEDLVSRVYRNVSFSEKYGVKQLLTEKFLEQNKVCSEVCYVYNSKKEYYHKQDGKYHIPLSYLSLLLDENTPYLANLLKETICGITLSISDEKSYVEAYLESLALLPDEEKQVITSVCILTYEDLNLLEFILKIFFNIKTLIPVCEKGHESQMEKFYDLMKSYPKVTFEKK